LDIYWTNLRFSGKLCMKYIMNKNIQNINDIARRIYNGISGLAILP